MSIPSMFFFSLTICNSVGQVDPKWNHNTIAFLLSWNHWALSNDQLPTLSEQQLQNMYFVLCALLKVSDDQCTFEVILVWTMFVLSAL